MALAVVVEPDLGGAAAFDHVIDFLVDVLLGIERARARHLDDVAAPLAFGAVQLDVAAAPAGAFPWGQRKILHLADADVAEHRDAFRLHEDVVGRLRPAELAEAGALAAGRLMPVRLARDVMHGRSPLSRRSDRCPRLPSPRARSAWRGGVGGGGCKRTDNESPPPRLASRCAQCSTTLPTASRGEGKAAATAHFTHAPSPRPPASSRSANPPAPRRRPCPYWTSARASPAPARTACGSRGFSSA